MLNQNQTDLKFFFQSMERAIVKMKIVAAIIVTACVISLSPLRMHLFPVARGVDDVNVPQNAVSRLFESGPQLESSIQAED